MYAREFSKHGTLTKNYRIITIEFFNKTHQSVTTIFQAFRRNKAISPKAGGGPVPVAGSEVANA
jgi:hypothetical protein